MTTNPITIQAKSSVAQALHEIANNEFSTYPVVDDRGGFVGLVTEARLRRTAAEGERDQRVNEIVQPAALIEPLDTLVKAVVRIEKSGVRQLAVVDGRNGNRLIGLLTMSDIVRAHAHAALEAGDADRSVAPQSFQPTQNPD